MDAAGIRMSVWASRPPRLPLTEATSVCKVNVCEIQFQSDPTHENDILAALEYTAAASSYLQLEGIIRAEEQGHES